MLEQSTLHGRIFCSKQAGKMIASKPAAAGDIRFGPMRPVQIYRISDTEMWVQDRNKGDYYHYLGTFGCMDLKLEKVYSRNDICISDYVSDDGFFYYFGKALYNVKNERNSDESEHLYFVQNMPDISYDGIPDISVMQMPLTIQALDYERVFHYSGEIRTLLENVPACYVDRLKRPIKRIFGRTYPISMENVGTTIKNLPETTYPVVFDFGKTVFGIADLEPEHTEDDLKHFDSLPGYYEEETPHGGKHKLVIIKENSFKYRYSPGLEIINQSQVTLYGIHAKWLMDNPPAIDTSKYQTVGHTAHQVIARLKRPDVSEEVRLLKEKAEENMSAAAMVAAKLYRTDVDDSHGEFVALYTLYEQDIAPYKAQFEKDLLPWILEKYSEDVISHRDKHETLRQGLPYLVYLAAIIIGKKDRGLTWTENRKCLSSEQGH